MKNQRKINEYYGKPKRRDFWFERVFNPQKSGTNEIVQNGNLIKKGTNQAKKLPIREFIPNVGMNRHQKRAQMAYNK